MDSFQKRHILLAFGLIVSALSVVAGQFNLSDEYPYKRLNGQVMPTTGESKTVKIGMPIVKEMQEPLYIFLDYNGQIPLSQRLAINPGAGRVEVTLLPISKNISVSVIPQADVHTYLNAMESYNAEKMQEKKKEEALMAQVGKGVQIIKQFKPGSWVTEMNDPIYQKHQQELNKNMKRIANIMYEEISDGQIISLPNPFGTTPLDTAPEVVEPVITAEESPAQEQIAEESLVTPEEPSVEESSTEEPLMQPEMMQDEMAKQEIIQPEMMQPKVSDIDLSDKEVANESTANESGADESGTDESGADESSENIVKENEE